jgi:hypothetical protein
MAKLVVKLSETCSTLWMSVFLTVPLIGCVHHDNMPLIMFEAGRTALVIGNEEVLHVMKNHLVRVKENGVNGVVARAKAEADKLSACGYELFGDFCQTIRSIEIEGE